MYLALVILKHIIMRTFILTLIFAMALSSISCTDTAEDEIYYEEATGDDGKVEPGREDGDQ